MDLYGKIDYKIQELQEKTEKLPENVSTLSSDFKNWFHCLEELKVLQQKLSQRKNTHKEDAKTNQKNFQNFKLWLEKNGVNMNYVKFGINLKQDSMDVGNGLVATQNIKKGEKILQIPLSVMMTLDTALKNLEEFSELISTNPIIAQLPSVGLALHVLYEKLRSNSFWKPYISILPSSFTTPYYLSLAQLQNLKGSPIEIDAARLLKNTIRHYIYFYKIIKSYKSHIFSTSNFSYTNYIWAISVVMTRQNEIPLKDNISQLALIPAWDMCNHCDGEITTFFDPQTQSVQCSALKDFEADHQVYIFYGKRPNSELFLYSGFIFPENKYDTLKVKAQPNKDDPFIREKLGLLTKYFQSSVFFISLYSVPPELMLYYRIVAMDENELKENYDFTQYKPLNETNEKRACQLLVQRLKEILQSYPQETKPQSEEFLSTYLLKQAEQRVLNSCISFLTTGEKPKEEEK